MILCPALRTDKHWTNVDSSHQRTCTCNVHKYLCNVHVHVLNLAYQMAFSWNAYMYIHSCTCTCKSVSPGHQARLTEAYVYMYMYMYIVYSVWEVQTTQHIKSIHVFVYLYANLGPCQNSQLTWNLVAAYEHLYIYAGPSWVCLWCMRLAISLSPCLLFPLMDPMVLKVATCELHILLLCGIIVRCIAYLHT